MGILRYLVLVAGNGGPAIVAAVVFYNTLTTAPSQGQDPSGSAGFGAAMIALCAAMMLFVGPGNSSRSVRLGHRTLIGISTMASAYLWIAAESQADPAKWELPSELATILFVGAGLAMIITPVGMILWLGISRWYR